MMADKSENEVGSLAAGGTDEQNQDAITTTTATDKDDAATTTTAAATAAPADDPVVQDEKVLPSSPKTPVPRAAVEEDGASTGLASTATAMVGTESTDTNDDGLTAPVDDAAQVNRILSSPTTTCIPSSPAEPGPARTALNSPKTLVAPIAVGNASPTPTGTIAVIDTTIAKDDDESTTVAASDPIEAKKIISSPSTPIPPAYTDNASTPATGPGNSVVTSPIQDSSDFVPLVTVVGFHHARGPEVESWFGAPHGTDPAVENGWHLLPFMALSDGAHASEEDFSYFTLVRPAVPVSASASASTSTDTRPAISLFGLSCTRQIDSASLLNRPADVTRSTVQKAVVVIADSPQRFDVLRERLSMVTHAWFAQRDFSDVDILRHFQESLVDDKARADLTDTSRRDQYLGMSLRELIHEYKWQTLVLLKCCLLQPKMLFFCSRCDKLCMVQFALISLIPGLIRNLQDCAGPELNAYEEHLAPPTSLQSSDRASLLPFMGLPLQIFGKGAIFGPYTPLQQLDLLADVGTKSYLVGSTNSLLLQQRDRYSDILINLDEGTVNITSPSLKTALALTPADRRWIDLLTQQINETWDEANPSRPKTLQYAGSEEYIRSQFEAYILGLISSVKFHNFLALQRDGTQGSVLTGEEDPAIDFGLEWIAAWKRTENYRVWDAHTDANLFAVSEPKHPCAGGLTIDDVQRRIAEQVKDLHLDERLAQGREMLGRNLAAGREKASSMFSKLYSDMEYLRESQRRKAADDVPQAGGSGNSSASITSVSTGTSISTGSGTPTASTKSAAYAVDLAKAQATMQSVGNKAGAYMSSWASWAGEKRKNTGWASGWRNSKPQPKDETNKSGASTAVNPIEKDYQMVSPSGSRAVSANNEHNNNVVGNSDSMKTTSRSRPITQQSFGESILSAARSSLDDTSLHSIGSDEEEDASPVTTAFESAAESVSGSATPAKEQGGIIVEGDKTAVRKTSATGGLGLGHDGHDGHDDKGNDGFQTESLVGKTTPSPTTTSPPVPLGEVAAESMTTAEENAAELDGS